MKSHEEIAPVFLGEFIAIIESKSQRRRMCLKVNKALSLKRFHAGIPYIDILIKISVVNVLAIAYWPTIIPAFLDKIDLIRGQVIPKLVPAIFSSIHLSRYWMNNHTHGIP